MGGGSPRLEKSLSVGATIGGAGRYTSPSGRLGRRQRPIGSARAAAEGPRQGRPRQASSRSPHMRGTSAPGGHRAGQGRRQPGGKGKTGRGGGGPEGGDGAVDVRRPEGRQSPAQRRHPAILHSGLFLWTDDASRVGSEARTDYQPCRWSAAMFTRRRRLTPWQIDGEKVGGRGSRSALGCRVQHRPSCHEGSEEVWPGGNGWGSSREPQTRASFGFPGNQCWTVRC